MSKIIEEYTRFHQDESQATVYTVFAFILYVRCTTTRLRFLFYISCNTTAHAVYTGVPRTENTVAVFLEIISRDRKFDLRDLSSRTNVVAVKSIRGHQTYYKRTSTNTT